MNPAILTALATARAFQQRSQAQRVVLLLDLEPIVMIDIEPDAATITQGDAERPIPEQIAAVPEPLPEIRPVPASAISIDVETGELAAPLGTIQHLADSVKALAQAFGGLTVATAEFATSDPELPITLAAREGEPVVLGAGDAQYEL